MKSRTAKGGSWNKERYSNKPRLRMQNCWRFEPTWDPIKWKPESTPEPQKDRKNIPECSQKSSLSG